MYSISTNQITYKTNWQIYVFLGDARLTLRGILGQPKRSCHRSLFPQILNTSPRWKLVFERLKKRSFVVWVVRITPVEISKVTTTRIERMTYAMLSPKRCSGTLVAPKGFSEWTSRQKARRLSKEKSDWKFPAELWYDAASKEWSWNAHIFSEDCCIDFRLEIEFRKTIGGCFWPTSWMADMNRVKALIAIAFSLWSSRPGGIRVLVCTGLLNSLEKLSGLLRITFDVAKVEECVAKDGLSLMQAEQAASEAANASGSPTMLINGKPTSAVYKYGASDVYKETICSAFTTLPSECSVALNSTQVAQGGSCTT